jgi:hypothetical protein
LDQAKLVIGGTQAHELLALAWTIEEMATPATIASTSVPASTVGDGRMRA